MRANTYKSHKDSKRALSMIAMENIHVFYASFLLIVHWSTKSPKIHWVAGKAAHSSQGKTLICQYHNGWMRTINDDLFFGRLLFAFRLNMKYRWNELAIIIDCSGVVAERKGILWMVSSVNLQITNPLLLLVLEKFFIFQWRLAFFPSNTSHWIRLQITMMNWYLIFLTSNTQYLYAGCFCHCKNGMKRNRIKRASPGLCQP